MHDAEAFGALSHSAKLDAAMTGFDCVLAAWVAS
jgi:hypothetical protein